jgi:DNA-binding NarL/FixJ family response regulator
VVATASHADTLLQAVNLHQPFLVVIDEAICNGPIDQMCKAIKQASAGARILVLAASQRTLVVEDAVIAGAAGYLPCTASGEEVLEGIEQILRGGTAYSPASAGIVQDMACGKGLNHLLGRKKITILQMAYQGKSDYDIGVALHMSKYSVRRYRYLAFELLGLRNQREADRFAEDHGLVERKDEGAKRAWAR